LRTLFETKVALGWRALSNQTGRLTSVSPSSVPVSMLLISTLDLESAGLGPGRIEAGPGDEALEAPLGGYVHLLYCKNELALSGVHGPVLRSGGKGDQNQQHQQGFHGRFLDGSGKLSGYAQRSSRSCAVNASYRDKSHAMRQNSTLR
jgi:hypothetical protein